MLTTNAAQFLTKFRTLTPSEHAVTMRQALLVDPTGFRISEQSAADNAYMDTNLAVNHALAMEQHAGVAQKIRDLGVPVKVFPGIVGQDDGMYPNNVFATKQGRLIIGHMFHPVRQAEAERSDIRNYFSQELGYEIVDLSKSPGICELTGAIIIDHARKVGFVGLTNRADMQGAQAMHDAFGLALTFCFPLTKNEYHTNILLSLFAGRGGVIYPESIADRSAADAIIEAYEGRLAVIDEKEKNLFVGNCLAITPQDVLFSQTSVKAMRAETRATIEKQGFRIHGANITELEKGGGSLRCLIAEIF